MHIRGEASEAAAQAIAIYADESCLGNGREGSNPGGGGGRHRVLEAGDRDGSDPLRLLGVRAGDDEQPDGAAERDRGIQRDLPQRGAVSRLFTSDSQYLVKGMTEWVHGWIEPRVADEGWARSRTSSCGRSSSTRPRRTWCSGSGCAATRAIRRTSTPTTSRCGRPGSRSSSNGVVASGFDEWLAAEREKGRVPGEPQPFRMEGGRAGGGRDEKMKKLLVALIVGLAMGYHWGYDEGSDGKPSWPFACSIDSACPSSGPLRKPTTVGSTKPASQSARAGI